MAAAALHPLRPLRVAATLLALLAWAAPPAFAVLGPPTNITLTADCTKLTLNATPVAGATGYVVRTQVNDYGPNPPDTVIAGFPYYDFPTQLGEKRGYQIATLDSAAIIGPFSNFMNQAELLPPVGEAGT